MDLELTVPIYLVFLFLSSFVIGLVLWRNRKVLVFRYERIFDFILLYNLFSILIARFVFVFENISIFKNISWSIYPYYFDPGAERVWFKQMPWILLKFWSGDINYSAILLGGLIFALIYFFIKKIPKKMLYYLIQALCMSQIIQLFGFFISSVYKGKVTDLPIGIVYPQGSEYRLPLQFIEVVFICFLIYLFNLLKKKKKESGILGVYLFAFGWLQIIVDYLKDGMYTQKSDINILQLIYILFVFIGIVIAIFAYQGDNEKLTNIQLGMQTNNNGQGIKKDNLNFGYRDYQSSYSTYQKSKPSLGAWIKRKFFSRNK